MQINPVNQAADFNLPIRGTGEKTEIPATASKPAAPKEPPDAPDQIEVKDVSPAATESGEQQQTSLKFSLDQQTHELVVELVNNQTGESIRQAPSEVSLKLTAIYAGIQGKLVDKNY